MATPFLTMFSTFEGVWVQGPKNILLFSFRFFKVVSSKAVLVFFCSSAFFYIYKYKLIIYFLLNLYYIYLLINNNISSLKI